MPSIDTQLFAHLAQRIEPESWLFRTWPLNGGISARMTAFEIERSDGRTQCLIVRQPGEASLKRNPNAAAGEYKLLHLLIAGGLPTQTPHHLIWGGRTS